MRRPVRSGGWRCGWRRARRQRDDVGRHVARVAEQGQRAATTRDQLDDEEGPDEDERDPQPPPVGRPGCSWPWPLPCVLPRCRTRRISEPPPPDPRPSQRTPRPSLSTVPAAGETAGPRPAPGIQCRHGRPRPHRRRPDARRAAGSSTPSTRPSSSPPSSSSSGCRASPAPTPRASLQHTVARWCEEAGLEVDTWALDLDALRADPDFPGTEAARGRGLRRRRHLEGGRCAGLVLEGHVDVVPVGDIANWPDAQPFSASI